MPSPLHAYEKNAQLLFSTKTRNPHLSLLLVKEYSHVSESLVITVTATHADVVTCSSHTLCYIFVSVCYLFAFITEARAYDRNILIDI